MALAPALNVKGLMNVQFAVAECARRRTPEIYVLEVNPRASRTVPFVSKATGVPLARLAALVMVGKTLDELGVHGEVVPTHFSVKESVFPFNKFPGVDIILGPEMRSTGEVMGIDDTFPMAFAKSQMAANSPLPDDGHDLHLGGRPRQAGDRADRPAVRRDGLHAARRRAARPRRCARPASRSTEIPKIQEGRPNLIDHMKNGEIALDHQHAERPRPAHGRRQDPRRGRGASRDVHHDALGGRGGRRSLPGAAANRN